MIGLTGITKDVVLPDGKELRILDEVGLAVGAGEMVAIRGRSGSGKTTLLNILGLLDLPSDGEYELSGRPVSALGDRERSRLRGSSIGFVFQQFHLLQRRSAWQNVAAPLLHERDRTRIVGRRSKAHEMLAAVGLEHRVDSLPSQLSGGEQQRVAIARALVRRPEVLLADEPTGSLDSSTGAQVLALLTELASTTGTTLIVVTHDDQVAAAMQRQLTLDGGHIEVPHEAS